MVWGHRLPLIVAMSITLVVFTGYEPNSSPSGTNEASPTPTATSGPVTLRVRSAHYHPNDTIEVILSNASSSTIYFPDHLTDCTVIQLRRQVNGGWEVINKCLLMTAIRWHTLDAGKRLVVKLVPPTGHPWAVGLYQATLSYKTTLEHGPLVSIYSAGFRVKPDKEEESPTPFLSSFVSMGQTFGDKQVQPVYSTE